MVSTVLKVIKNTLFLEGKTLPLVLLWNISRKKSIHATLWIRCDSQSLSDHLEESKEDLLQLAIWFEDLLSAGCVPESLIELCFVLLHFVFKIHMVRFYSRIYKEKYQRLCGDVKVKVFFKSMNQLTLFDF